MKEFIILGCFWQDATLKARFPIPFIGIIRLADDNTFNGEITDALYGKASIIMGKINGTQLTFIKMYPFESNGAKENIKYTLNGNGFNEAGKNICTGWIGNFVIQDALKTFGRCNCTISPLT